MADYDDAFVEPMAETSSPARILGESPPPKVRKKKVVVFPDDLEPWADKHGKTVFSGGVHGLETKTAMWQLAQEEFEGHPSNGVWWKPEKPYSRRRDNDTVQLWYCTYKNQSKCTYRIKMVTDNDTQETSIFKGVIPHANHSINYFKSQQPIQVKTSVIQSPSHLKTSPARLVKKAAAKGLNLDEDVQRKAKQQLEKLKKAVQTAVLEEGSDGRAWGDLITIANSFKRADIALADKPFTPHTIYLLGGKSLLKNVSLLPFLPRRCS